MRLIDTATLALTEHPDSKLPEKGYAILSHRWLTSDEEVTFEDLEHGGDFSHKKGFAKLRGFCSEALSQGYDYAWSDTCCINKGSSTELGSALNSMFRWYADAKLCLVYLEDVYEGGKVLNESEWFERGWTLQELIAPTALEFFNRDWQSIGTKTDHVDLLSATTGIPNRILTHKTTLDSCSIAQRMSWAAHRITERIEDQAYSLLGLFDVSLEMIYGEREKAFIRLQEKIIQYSADQSIFTWSMDPDIYKERYGGLFATSPSAFALCGDVSKGVESSAFSMTNLGLSISLSTLPYAMETYLAFLDCTRVGSHWCSCAIVVARLDNDGQWARVFGENNESVFLRLRSEQRQLGTTKRQICVRQNPGRPPMGFARSYGFWLRSLNPPLHSESLIKILSRTATTSQDRVSMESNTFGTAAIISFVPKEENLGEWYRVRWIILGFDDEFQPTVLIANRSSNAFNFSFIGYLDDAEKFGPGSPAHRKAFDNVWVRKEKLKDRQVQPSARNAWSKGFNIIKHQKPFSDWNYTFQALNLGIKFSLVPDCEPGTSNSTSKSIWAVDVTTLEGESPARARRKEEASALALIIIGTLLCPIGGTYCCTEGCSRIEEEG